MQHNPLATVIASNEAWQNSAPASQTEGPQPLTRPLADPEPFDETRMGRALGAATSAIHEHTLAPLTLCAQSVLGAAALGVQGLADITLPTDSTRPASLFLFSIGGTGERKSSVDEKALWPVRDREKTLREQYEADLPSWRNLNDAWTKQRDQILADKKVCPTKESKRDALDAIGAAPARPLAPILTASDPTLEGLHKLYEIGQPSLGLFSAEGGVFVGGHGMSTENRMRTASGLSLLWDGATINRIRAGDGASILPGRRLSMHLMAQPDIATAMLCDPVLADQGLLSRILTMAPKSTIGTRFYKEPSQAANAALRQYWARLSHALETPARMTEGKTNELDPRALAMTAKAQEPWKRYADYVERSMAPGGAMEPIRGLAAKLPEHAARIATVICLFDNPDAGELPGDYMDHGIYLAQYYAAEAVRLAQAGMIDPKTRLAVDALHWLNTSWDGDCISLPDLYQRGPSPIREKKTASEVVATLEGHGWLRRIDGGATINGAFRRDAWRVMEG